MRLKLAHWEPTALGTHSIRKLPATHARKNGCGREDVDKRGRWRQKVSTVDRYIDIPLSCIDAKVAAALCVGGPVKYKRVNGSGISDQWLAANVVPHILQRFPGETSGLGMTLALPLLWACIDESMENKVPVDLRDRIRHAYAAIRQLDQGINPVIKVPIIIYRAEERLLIDELMPNDVEQQHDAGVGVDNPLQHTHQALMSQIHAQRVELAELRAIFVESFGANHVNMDRQFEVLNRNLCRIAVAAARPINRGATVRNNDHNVLDNSAEHNLVPPLVSSCTLSRTPRSLYDLWVEYETGIGGRKAAKDFTAVERGRVKSTYHLRKVVWDCIAARVRSGEMAHVAIDRIYDTYGRNQSITKIIQHMRRDNKATGGHPNLRV